MTPHDLTLARMVAIATGKTGAATAGQAIADLRQLIEEEKLEPLWRRADNLTPRFRRLARDLPVFDPQPVLVRKPQPVEPPPLKVEAPKPKPQPVEPPPPPPELVEEEVATAVVPEAPPPEPPAPAKPHDNAPATPAKPARKPRGQRLPWTPPSTPAPSAAIATGVAKGAWKVGEDMVLRPDWNKNGEKKGRPPRSAYVTREEAERRLAHS